jgi:hypothetical protein
MWAVVTLTVEYSVQLVLQKTNISKHEETKHLSTCYGYIKNKKTQGCPYEK